MSHQGTLNYVVCVCVCVYEVCSPRSVLAPFNSSLKTQLRLPKASSPVPQHLIYAYL